MAFDSHSILTPHKKGFLSGGGGGSVADSESDEIFLNLTPMIDVLTTLLFFLLMSFGAVIIALINADVPVQSDSEGDQATGRDEVTIGLSINDKGLSVNAINDSLSESELAGLKRSFGKKGKEYDFKGLHDYLYQVKQKFPKSKTIIITPTKEILYEVLIQAMDASRDREVRIGRKSVRMPIFPQAIVSKIVE